ncbi:ArsR family transcriptional regulator [Actinomadura sp. NBRC 104412]|uniref:helix-turn-helix transcriptional regulator n=1 Tax=Actinomadura sp. NBRC 104412 TaxID=3032203 RepID=UPI0024A3DFC0|nr:helix-turn-helix domain-containing protein [Actinomadura sp. NBRC 104412]GLZ02653.1 ArsR family transcriptional regulator [Actinomadura sp. NBRC 104412]
MADHDSPSDPIESIGALAEDLRRRMFAFIRRARRPVTRDEAAASVGISRKLAAFHLDKLVDAGLLRAHYGAPGGLRKVGRQPKVYEPTDTRIRLSIPDSRHELLADLLLTAVVSQRDEETAVQAALRAAHERGRDLGEHQQSTLRPRRLGAERGVTLCERMLEEHGFEPVRESPTRLTLHNCPFQPQAAKAPDLVCGMNHAFVTGYLQGLGATAVQAVLAPRPGECCVELRQAGT